MRNLSAHPLLDEQAEEFTMITVDLPNPPVFSKIFDDFLA